MQVRLKAKGFENYTGNFGEMSFVDGVSVQELNESQINRMASITQVERLDGAPVGILGKIKAAVNDKAPVVPARKRASEIEPAAVVEKDEPEEKAQKADVKTYSRSELEDVADKEGIAGLRAIAELHEGVKGVSIISLIDGILSAQSHAKPEKITH